MDIGLKQARYLLREALTGMDGEKARTYGMSLYMLWPVKLDLDIELSHLKQSAEILKEEHSDIGGDLDEILTRGVNVNEHGR